NYVRKNLDDQVKRVIDSQGKITDEGVEAAVAEVLESEVSRRHKPPLLSSLPTDHADKIAAAYGADIDKLIAEIFAKLPIGPSAAEHLRDLALGLFTRDSFVSSQSSGIVVAGFGTGDTYPSLEWIQVHGRTAGRLESRMGESAIIRPDMEAAIVPFAQREMVDAFMTGIDPKYAAAV